MRRTRVRRTSLTLQPAREFPPHATAWFTPSLNLTFSPKYNIIKDSITLDNSRSRFGTGLVLPGGIHPGAAQSGNRPGLFRATSALSSGHHGLCQPQPLPRHARQVGRDARNPRSPRKRRLTVPTPLNSSCWYNASGPNSPTRATGRLVSNAPSRRYQDKAACLITLAAQSPRHRENRRL